MKKIHLIIILLIFQYGFTQETNLTNNPDSAQFYTGDINQFGNVFSDESDKLQITINKNIELLGLGYFIGFEGIDIDKKTVEIDGEIIPKKDWHNYGFKIYEQYKSFATSDNLAKSFSVADHLWLDYLTAFLLQVNDVPNAQLSNSIHEKYYINFSKEKDIQEAKKNAQIFLEGLNAFAKEIKFDSYLSSSKEYYTKVIQEVKTSIPNKNFIKEMELFYDKVFDKYLLIPSLTIPKGMGFGIKATKDKNTVVYNVFGALDFQEFDNNKKLVMGFSNEKKLRELSIHEFGHSFVNPVVAELPGEFFKNTEHLFKPLKSAMSDQGYNTWKACVYEHFVRAGEILIAEKLGENTKELTKEYEQTRQFKYIPEILFELKKYNDGLYKSYYEAIEKAMEKLKSL